MAREISFSKKIITLLESKKILTVGSVLDAFDEKSFAFLFLLLMIFSAAPIPTGGITSIFEIIVIITALQLVFLREDLWLPRWLSKRKIPKSLKKGALPFLLNKISFVEKFSKPRFYKAFDTKWFRFQLGIAVIFCTFGALVAPPFSGLDTLPSLGVVFISIGVILDDLYAILFGYLVGAIGLALIFLLGAGVITLVSQTFQF